MTSDRTPLVSIASVAIMVNGTLRSRRSTSRDQAANSILGVLRRPEQLQDIKHGAKAGPGFRVTRATAIPSCVAERSTFASRSALMLKTTAVRSGNRHRALPRLRAVTQVRSQEVYSRSLNLETPSSLTTLIANLSETNNELRNEIFDLRRDVLEARDSVANGKGTLTEAQRQLLRLRVFSAQSAVTGPGISIKIEGSFDERALSDLVNELRNAGAEAIAVNECAWVRGATSQARPTARSRLMVALSRSVVIRAIGSQPTCSCTSQ